MRTLVSLSTTLLSLMFFVTAACGISAAVTVTVTSPTFSSVNTSFTVNASATSSNTVTGWWIYVDGNGVWNTPGPTSSISAPITVSAGSHNIVVKAWDSTGANGYQSFSVSASTSTPTSTSSSGTSVTVLSPLNGASVSNPVTFQATATSPNGIAGWVIYIDNYNAYQVDNYSNSLTASVSVGGGSHSVYIRAWDRVSGFGTSPTFSINVGASTSTSTSGLPTPPSTATVFSNVEDMSGFKSCSANCAGGNSTTNYWMAQYQSSPSLDGSSVQFFNGGSAWANVLWYKPLGANNWASNFLWDFYVYYDSTTIANLHTAEFDLYQSINGIELMVGSQCNFGEGRWDVWNQTSNQWISTSIPCYRFSSGTWHHIQWYMQRVSSTQYKYVTLAVDGKSYSVNQTYSGNYQGWNDTLGVQWQLDLGAYGVDAHEWVDKIKLTIW